jgi:hypothetical protein
MMKKTLAIVLSVIVVASAFSLIATVSAMPFMPMRPFAQGPMMRGPFGFGWFHPGNSSTIQATSVRLDGPIAKWGDTNVTGGVQAKATTIINGTEIRQASAATAIWDINNFRPEAAAWSKQNFTFAFYTARLVNPQATVLNTSGNDLYMNGTWNVNKMTSTFTIYTNANGNVTGFNRNQTITEVQAGAYGELKVTGSWTKFTLSITGIDALTGSVHAQKTSMKLCNPFKIANDDSATVTTADVAAVAKAFGTMPGWGNYDQRLDYNFDYKVDICDLTTATANLNR